MMRKILNGLISIWLIIWAVVVILCLAAGLIVFALVDLICTTAIKCFKYLKQNL